MDQGARLDQKRDRAVAKRRRKPNIKALTLRIRARIVSLARREVRVHRSTPLGAPISLSPLHQLYVSSIICHLRRFMFDHSSSRAADSGDCCLVFSFFAVSNQGTSLVRKEKGLEKSLSSAVIQTKLR